MSEEVSLHLVCADLDNSKLQDITRDLTKSLREQNVGTVRMAESRSEPGGKGDPVMIGNIILALIGSGGVAVTLIQVLKAYVERKASMSFEFSRPDGKKVVLNSENLGKGQMAETAKLVEQFLKD